MRSADELRVDIGDGRRTAVRLHWPDRVGDRPTVAFAFPGGCYARGYFDIQWGGTDYSEAAFHTRRGWILAACDHLGVGDSDPCDPALGVEDLADANDATVRAVLAQLDVEPALVLGMGQSMGAGLSIVAQARHRTFDAVAVLGFSAIHNVLPVPPPGAGRVDAFRWGMHSDDSDPSLVAADVDGGLPAREEPAPPWGSVRRLEQARRMVTPGVVADFAAAVDVPLFLGFGDRDVAPDPRAEPAAYPASEDITLVVVPDMAHMHNFARTRDRLWARLQAWGDALRPA